MALTCPPTRRSSGRCSPRFAKPATGDWDYSIDPNADAGPAVVIKPAGKGQVVYLNRTIDVFLRNAPLNEKLQAALTTAGRRTASSPSPDIKIAVRQGSGDTTYLCVCNRNSTEPVEATITVKGRYPQPVDLCVPQGFPRSRCGRR